MSTDTRPLTDEEDDTEGFLGCGLHSYELAIILAASVTVFLFWNGPLWSAPTGASHVARIAFSYLLVVPLAIAALALRRRLGWFHLLSSIALLWSIKLIVTSLLYAYLAAGSASRYAPAETWRSPPPSAPPTQSPYRPNPSFVSGTDLSGTVREKQTPLNNAVIIIEEPLFGLPLPPSHEVPLILRDSRYVQSISLATTKDTISLHNEDTSLHTARFSQNGRTVRNVPLPPGGNQLAITDLAPGIYRLACDSVERATLVITDHPYAALTDEAGHFRLRDLPPGHFTLSIVRDGRPPLRRAIDVSGARLDTSIDLAEEE